MFSLMWDQVGVLLAFKGVMIGTDERSVDTLSGKILLNLLSNDR